MILLDTLLALVFFFALIATAVFLLLAVFQRVKKDDNKAKKHFKLTGFSFLLAVIAFITFGTFGEENTNETVEKAVADVAEEKEPGETDEEKMVREQKEAEEKVLEEQKAKADDEIKTKTEPVVASTWRDKVNEIAQAVGSATDKYDAIMLYAKDYPATDDEIAEFEKYIIAQYQSKEYLADITNSEYMIGNIFRANVINVFYGQVNSPINNFAFDFYQNTKYTYRGVDAIDSDAVRSNERQMDKALKEIK